MEHQCPHCGYLIKAGELRDEKQPILKNYRLCPHCDTRLTVDRKTRLRQLFLVIIAVALLIIFFTPSYMAKIVSGIGLILMLVYVFWADKKIKFEEIDNPASERKIND